MRNEINYLAEFSDPTIEREFQAIEIEKGIQASRYTFLTFGIVNLAFVAADYLYLAYEDISFVLYHSFIPRLVVFVMALASSVALKRASNKKAVIRAMLAAAMLAYLLHEYTAIRFAPVQLIFEILDIVIISFGLFMVPNRWIANMCACVAMIVIFFALSPLTIPSMDVGMKLLITLYLLLHVLMVGVLMYRISNHKRRNYLQQLQLEALADTDGLTKVHNRTSCDRMLADMCEKRAAFSLIMVDMDDFKQINDTHGHLAGDAVIKEVIDAIKREIRQNDVVARWGGEEFVVILPHATLEGAREIARRVKDLIAKIEFDGKTGCVTASMGVTAFIEGDDMRSIINRADRLMYEAKSRGKNNVVAG